MKNPDYTRNHIIDVAAPVFNKNGYVGTSLSDILEQTNLTKGAIYHHFANKDELALAALEYNLRLVSDHIFRVVDETAHSCDMLTAFARSFSKNYNTMKQMGGCPVVNAAVDSDDVNEQIRTRVCRFIRMWEKALMTIIENGKTKSEIRADADSEKFSMNFISIIEGSLAISKVYDNRKYVDNAVELITEIVERMRIG